VTFTAYTSGYDDEVMIFDSACCEGEVQFRHVVAVKVSGRWSFASGWTGCTIHTLSRLGPTRNLSNLDL
jgi:hypothetical protein